MKYKVAASVTTCISNNPGIGWVRADQVERIAESIKQYAIIDADKIMPGY